MNKLLGIFGVLFLICFGTTLINPSFVTPFNLENTVRWTALFGILSVGACFVIITGGIDLSMGSLVALVGAFLCTAITKWGYSPVTATLLALSLSAGIGLLHGLLITRLKLQPFVVTLCGLLIYRGVARWITADMNVGLGNVHDDGFRRLAIGKEMPLAVVVLGLALLGVLYNVLRSRGSWKEALRKPSLALCGFALLVFAALPFVLLEFPKPAHLGASPPLVATALWSLSTVLAPTPLLILIGVGLVLGIVLRHLPLGRHLLAVGANEEAARYCGIPTQRVIIFAYVVCSLLGGLGGVLFTLDLNSVQSDRLGNFYELYAIAAAVLGGASLRGGEGYILGAIIATAVIRTLFNAINILGIPKQLEFPILGIIILLGVLADDAFRGMAVRRAQMLRAKIVKDNPS